MLEQYYNNTTVQEFNGLLIVQSHRTDMCTEHNQTIWYF